MCACPEHLGLRCTSSESQQQATAAPGRECAPLHRIVLLLRCLEVSNVEQPRTYRVKNRRLAGKQCLAQQTSGARLITYPTHPQQQSYSRYCDTIGAWASAVSTASVPGIDGAEHIHKTSKSVGPRWSRRIERVQQDPAGETKRDDVRLEASSLPLSSPPSLSTLGRSMGA